jgi:hypothetical protein
VNRGRIDIAGLKTALAGVPVPRAAGGPEAHACPDRVLCHTYERGKDPHIMIPGWPHSLVTALFGHLTQYGRFGQFPGSYSPGRNLKSGFVEIGVVGMEEHEEPTISGARQRRRGRHRRLPRPGDQQDLVWRW